MLSFCCSGNSHTARWCVEKESSDTFQTSEVSTCCLQDCTIALSCKRMQCQVGPMPDMPVLLTQCDRLVAHGIPVPLGPVVHLALRRLGSYGVWEPCQVSHGWQKFASEAVHEHHRVNVVWSQLSPNERALVRSQSGPFSSVPFTAMPIHRVSKLDSEPFRVLLLRRLRLPLPFTVCTCGRPLDAFGHHRAACSTGGLLGRRGFRSRECHRSDISGGWSQGVHERDGEGP